MHDTLAFTGRFQPFHLGHWEIVDQLLQRAERLYIGITNPDIHALDSKSSSPHRHRADSNPFRIEERRAMIQATLDELNASHCKTVIVPFSLDDPARWAEYIPLSAVQVVRVFSAWEDEKVERLQAGGYRVEKIIGDPASKIAACDIRAALRQTKSTKAWLPQAVLRTLNDIGNGELQRRLSDIDAS